MNIVTLLIGILLAAAVFAAFIWSGYRAFYTTGWLRRAHAALALLTLAGFAALSLLWPLAAAASGAGLVAAGLVALVLERGWAQLLVLVQIAFGGLLISGLPLAGG